MACLIEGNMWDITYHFFGDQTYAAVTGWPDMLQTHTHDGWRITANRQIRNALA